MSNEKSKLEVLQIQVMLGDKEGLSDNDIPAGFCWELISHIEKFMKEKNIKMLATVASFKTDEQYDGASRDLHLSRKN